MLTRLCTVPSHPPSIDRLCVSWSLHTLSCNAKDSSSAAPMPQTGVGSVDGTSLAAAAVGR